jgi:SAM-dependent methyltransferase
MPPVATATRPPPALVLMERLYGEDVYEGFGPVLEPDLQGWNSDHPAFAALFQEMRPRIVIDVGVWKGRSVVFMGNLMRELGINGMVVAVDTFLGSPEHWNRERPDKIYTSLRLRHGYPGLYWQFLSNILHAGMRERVVPLAQTSENAALILKRAGVKADLVHIDAAHEYEPVLRDARLYWDLLAPGGVLVGDDYTWPQVARAAQDFAASIGQPLEVREPKWILRKPTNHAKK